MNLKKSSYDAMRKTYNLIHTYKDQLTFMENPINRQMKCLTFSQQKENNNLFDTL